MLESFWILQYSCSRSPPPEITSSSSVEHDDRYEAGDVAGFGCKRETQWTARTPGGLEVLALHRFTNTNQRWLTPDPLHVQRSWRSLNGGLHRNAHLKSWKSWNPVGVSVCRRLFWMHVLCVQIFKWSPEYLTYSSCDSLRNLKANESMNHFKGAVENTALAFWGPPWRRPDRHRRSGHQLVRWPEAARGAGPRRLRQPGHLRARCHGHSLTSSHGLKPVVKC